MPPIRCRRSARAAPIPASRTPRIWPGSSPRCSRARRGTALIDSYDIERIQAADENIAPLDPLDRFHRRRIRPPSARLRDAVLALAPQGRVRPAHGQFRPAVGCRPSTTVRCRRRTRRRLAAAPGSARRCRTRRCASADGRDGSSAGTARRRLRSARHVDGMARGRRRRRASGCTVIGEDRIDHTGLFAQRFDATPGATYLLRPDQHLCARWRRFDAGKVRPRAPVRCATRDRICCFRTDEVARNGKARHRLAVRRSRRGLSSPWSRRAADCRRPTPPRSTPDWC